MSLRFRKKGKARDISPDEIFMDQYSNDPDFNRITHIEQRLPARALRGVALLAVLIVVVFTGQLFKLQVLEGSTHLSRSENNRVHTVPLFGQRGVILDRYGESIAWNDVSETSKREVSERRYMDTPGFSHIVGYVRYPQKDNNGFYWRQDIEGVTGLEFLFNEDLQGRLGSQLLETNAQMEVVNEVGSTAFEDGKNVYTSIDKELQQALGEELQFMVDNYDYTGAAAVVMDINTGELHSLVSVPEFSSEIFTNESNSGSVSQMLSSGEGLFLNRAIAGQYSPGSTVKPFVGLAGLQEGIITPETTYNSVGRIVVPNPYSPAEPAIFRDWREKGHGTVTIIEAISDSVNTFFYTLAGGVVNTDKPALGITKMSEYIKAFEIASPSGIVLSGEQGGVVPDPLWKRRVFNDGWRLGDTYISSIGQFGYQVTPIQMARAVGALASKGTLVTPTLLIEDSGETKKIEKYIAPEHYQTMHTAMRHTVTNGTARPLNVPYMKFAAKTGTAQVSASQKLVHSWVVGFYPYEDPKLSFAIVLEKGPDESPSASWVFGNVIRRVYGEAVENLREQPDVVLTESVALPSGYRIEE